MKDCVAIAQMKRHFSHKTPQPHYLYQLSICGLKCANAGQRLVERNITPLQQLHKQVDKPVKHINLKLFLEGILRYLSSKWESKDYSV